MEIRVRDGVEWNVIEETGEIRISWADETPDIPADPLVVLTFPQAVESDLTFDSNVYLVDANGDQIGEVDIRSVALTSVREQVRVVVDAVMVKAQEKLSEVTIDVDLADIAYFTEQAVEKVVAMLALYENGRLVGIDVADAAAMDSGVSEVSLSASCGRKITDYVVFVVGDGSFPLASALRGK